MPKGNQRLPERGLVLEIYAGPGVTPRDTHALTRHVSEVVLLHPGLPFADELPSDSMPPVKIKSKRVAGEEIYYAEPVREMGQAPVEYIFGGSYVGTVDGRWQHLLARLTGTANCRTLPLHDMVLMHR